MSVAVIALLVVLVLLGCSVRRIAEDTRGIVERLGRFHAVVGPGTVFVVPLMDRVAARIDMTERVLRLAARPYATCDERSVEVTAVVRYVVVDARKARYEVHDLDVAVEQIAETTVRNAVHRLSVDDAVTAVSAVRTALTDELTEVARPWGLRINGVRVDRIAPEGTATAAGPVRKDPHR